MKWKSLRWILLAIAYVLLMSAIFVAVTTPAPAQEQNCVPLDQIMGLLKEWDEDLAAIGKAGELEMRLYVNAETGAWTALRIHPNGVACIIASGDSFDLVRPPGTPAGRAF